ncbi:MAG TPA: DUF262 domain-containing protein [Parafilimonas sp.]|nr:DUF262 domain-containing protein [Parafilimonas sp.]
MKTMNNQEEKALSVKDLLSKDKYIIPLYQRNYAWGKAEISQLIRDIKEFFESNSNKSKHYYIGSLVCFKRDNGDYELVDGQQRHTAILLINAVLKYLSNGIEVVETSNLKYDSRKNIQDFLETLYSSSDLNTFIEEQNIPGTQNFKDAIGFIREEFSEKKFEVEKFADNFYNKVKLFRVEVPQGTEVNHYFEIMNNRGEQLEKHEIVKAHLMGKIVNENEEIQQKEQSTFASIWDACSDMSDYVYFNFIEENRKNLFKNGNLLVKEFDDLTKKITSSIDDNKSALSKILSDINYILENFSQEGKTVKEKYKSVLDFPNFLLQILRLENDSVSLDDKNLLTAFRDRNVEPKDFCFKLLKYRTIFDNYIIKQDLSDSDAEKQNWGIRTLNDDYDGVQETFKDDDKELVNLQTMLYYSNPSKTNNKWVQKFLKGHAFEKGLAKFTNEVLEEARDRFDATNLSYPGITAYNIYFIDFQLWKLYKTDESKVAEELKPLKRKIANKKRHFDSFKFKQLNSKEHLFPQSEAQHFEINNEDLNGIGNLCLISTSQNSAGNKGLPTVKKKSFGNDNSSLKRLIMFESFEDEKWGTEQIRKHEDEIKMLLSVPSQGLPSAPLINNYSITDENTRPIDEPKVPLQAPSPAPLMESAVENTKPVAKPNVPEQELKPEILRKNRVYDSLKDILHPFNSLNGKLNYPWILYKKNIGTIGGKGGRSYQLDVAFQNGGSVHIIFGDMNQQDQAGRAFIWAKLSAMNMEKGFEIGPPGRYTKTYLLGDRTSEAVNADVVKFVKEFLIKLEEEKILD